jgi:hypothetical protein
MATFILGAIITNVAGSIGGTTLKRNGNYKVIMNKSTGTAYSRSLRNQALSYLGSIFKAWAFLEPSVQADWETQALSFTFPDKFGNLRNLTGRQLFIKLNGQRYQVDTALIDPTTITSVLDPFTISNLTYLTATHSLSLQFTQDPDATIRYLISWEISLQPLRSPTFISRKIGGQALLAGGTTLNVIDFLRNIYPYWTADYKTRVYVQSINDSGFKSVMQSVDMVINP